MKAKLLWSLQAAAILVAGIWVYAPALQGDWVWDDVVEVSRNPVLREPAAALGRIWFTPAGADYLPLKTTVQWAEWHLWGDNRFGYHATSLALHLLSALLFWRLLRRLFALAGGPARTLGPWLGGLIFAIHPLAVESVAWIAELKNTLSLPPLLLAMICYVAFDAEGSSPSRSRRRLALALACFLAAMLCKSSVVMFPVVLLLYAWWRRGRVTRADLRASAPFFAVSLALGLVTVWFQQHRAIGGADLATGGWLSRTAGAGRAILFYLGKFVWPAGLLPTYPRWQLTPPAPAQFLPWMAIAAALGWLWARRERGEGPGWKRTALFSLGCFGANLVPVLGFVPMAYLRISWVGDQLVYLPILGLVGLAAAGTAAAAERARSRPGGGALVAIFVAGLSALLACSSHRHAALFRDNETLWRYTLQANPESWTAHDNLGIVLRESGRNAEAIAEYQAALRLRPGEAEVHNNLGVAWHNAGRNAEAIDQYRGALRIQPEYAEADSNLGNALVATGRTAEAIAFYQEALRLNPGYAKAHNNLGSAFQRLGRMPEAIAQYEEAIRLSPEDPIAHRNLAVALRATGRPAAAEAEFKEAARRSAGPEAAP